MPLKAEPTHSLGYDALSANVPSLPLFPVDCLPDSLSTSSSSSDLPRLRAEPDAERSRLDVLQPTPSSSPFFLPSWLPGPFFSSSSSSLDSSSLLRLNLMGLKLSTSLMAASKSGSK
ncbi:hypothetical protein EYF80_002967 [Liparis tanakae]|uniref:Uncharacterized protein n=1 Tax=Liparis tanakae TaxID=230148 RepID=A0A4Z2JAE9_9TELE|nr:hypothetical protein EYF80_002967 [Liparis tanakae]